MNARAKKEEINENKRKKGRAMSGK